MRRPAAPRSGFTLIEVALASVIALIATIAVGTFFHNTYEQLSPRSSSAGLRKYLVAEDMLRAQAEGLRALRHIPLTDSQCKLVTEPSGMGYALTIARTRGPSHASQELYLYDLTMSHNGRVIQTLSMSTLRSIGTKEGQDEKIGL